MAYNDGNTPRKIENRKEFAAKEKIVRGLSPRLKTRLKTPLGPTGFLILKSKKWCVNIALYCPLYDRWWPNLTAKRVGTLDRGRCAHTAQRAWHRLSKTRPPGALFRDCCASIVTFLCWYYSLFTLERTDGIDITVQEITASGR